MYAILCLHERRIDAMLPSKTPILVFKTTVCTEMMYFIICSCLILCLF